MEDFKRYVPISKVDPEQHMVYGYATTEALDAQGEVVKLDAVKDALPDYMKFANIREMHQPKAVGKAKQATMDAKGLYLGVKVVDTDAWEKVKEGVLQGFSIGGAVVSKIDDVITKLKLSEISLVDRPANPEALIEVYKGEDIMPNKELKKEAQDVITLASIIQQLTNMIPEEQQEGDKVTVMALNSAITALKPAINQENSEPEIPMETMVWSEKTKDLSKAGIPEGSVGCPNCVGQPGAVGMINGQVCPECGGKGYVDADQVAANAPDKKVTENNHAEVGANQKETPKMSDVTSIESADKTKDLEKVAARDDVKPSEGKDKYGDVEFADETNKKYPLDTEEHVRAAASYFGMPKNRSKYSEADQKTIDNKISAAEKKFGIGEDNKKSDMPEFNLEMPTDEEITAGLNKQGITASQEMIDQVKFAHAGAIMENIQKIQAVTDKKAETDNEITKALNVVKEEMNKNMAKNTPQPFVYGRMVKNEIDITGNGQVETVTAPEATKPVEPTVEPVTPEATPESLPSKMPAEEVNTPEATVTPETPEAPATDVVTSADVAAIEAPVNPEIPTDTPTVPAESEKMSKIESNSQLAKVEARLSKLEKLDAEIKNLEERLVKVENTPAEVKAKAGYLVEKFENNISDELVKLEKEADDFSKVLNENPTRENQAHAQELMSKIMKAKRN